MEIRMVVFVAFISASAVINAAIMWGVYKAFAGLTSKVTETVSEFEKSSETRLWIASLQVAAKQAATVTEATKLKMAELEPVLGRAQENYRGTLVEVDSRVEEAAEEITKSAQKLRDVVAKPAFSVLAFAAGLSKVLEPTTEADE